MTTDTHSPPTHMCVITRMYMPKHVGICCISLPNMYTQARTHVYMLTSPPLAYMNVHTLSHSLSVFCKSFLVGSCLQKEINYGDRFLGASLCFPLPPAGNRNFYVVLCEPQDPCPPLSMVSRPTHTVHQPSVSSWGPPHLYHPDLLSVFYRSNPSP